MTASTKPTFSSAATNGSLPTSERMLEELVGPLEYSSGEPRFVDESSDEKHPDAEFSDDFDEIDEQTELDGAIREANAGCAIAKQAVEEHFRNNAASVKHCGSFGAMSRDWIIDEIAGDELANAEYAKRNADQLEMQLRSRDDSPLTRMARDRLLSAYVAAGAKDYLSTTRYDADKLPPEHVAAQESADRRFLIAMQALELAEKLEKPGAAAN